jgi:hypothetical protein
VLSNRSFARFRTVPRATVIPVLAYPDVNQAADSHSVADVDPENWGGSPEQL